MHYIKLLSALFCIITLTACQSGPRTGEVTKIDATNIEDYCLLHDVAVTTDGLLLKNRSSSITSQFNLRNFELTAKVKTTTGAEGVLIFAATDAASTADGYEIRINNSDYRVGSLQKTGSLARIRNNFVRTAQDNQWFTLGLTVEANHIKVQVNGKTVNEYDEPVNVVRASDISGRILTTGRVVIRRSNEIGEMLLEGFTIKPLKIVQPEQSLSAAPDSLTKVVDQLNDKEFPLIDFHTHLKGGLTMDQAVKHAQLIGCNYGVAANCGLKFPVTNDSTLNAYFHAIKDEPVFKAMQCEGREWVTLFSPKIIAQFDYIFTDAMTWTDLKGRRMRLWMPDETFVDNDEKFMDLLVSKIESELSNEPVDIHANPTFLPAKLAPDYDRLWTPERMDRVITVLKTYDVALEINSRFKIPSIAFIKRAKAAGVKFSFGTNNGSNNDLGRLEYCLKALKEAGLTKDDMFIPRSSNDKKVTKMGLPSKITG